MRVLKRGVWTKEFKCHRDRIFSGTGCGAVLEVELSDLGYFTPFETTFTFIAVHCPECGARLDVTNSIPKELKHLIRRVG